MGTQPPVKEYCSIVLYIQNNSVIYSNNNSVIFDSETTTRNSSGNGWPVNYQKLYEIKHQSKGSFRG